jgi:branched-chain amino acid transport system substrate-binding protein
LAAILAVVLLAAACGASVGTPGPATQPVATEPAGTEPAATDGETGDIIIGGSLTLTGIQAPFDEPGLRGAQVALDFINENGGTLGRQVELINLDGKSDPVVVGNNAIQLIERGAVAIIAPCDFDFGGPASREAQKLGVVGVSTCASSPLYSSTNLGDKQFTLSMWNTTMGSAAAEWGMKEKGWNTAYVVTDDFIDYTKSLSRYFIQSWEENGGTVIAEDDYTQGAGDFSAQLQRIQNLDTPPDVLFISSYNPDLGTIIRSIRAAGITTPVLGGDSYDDPQLVEVLGELGTDVYFVTHTFASPEAGENMAEFLELYDAKFGGVPDTAFVATGWDVMIVFDQAMEAAGSTEGAAVAKAMEDLTFDLLTGKLDWSPAADGHEPDKETALVQINPGEGTTFLGWFQPEFLPEP